MSSALLKVSELDQIANYLINKLASNDASVSITKTIVNGQEVINIQVPGGGTPAGIILGTVSTGTDYTLVPELKNIVFVTDPSAVITLPGADLFQEAVEYMIIDVSGLASETNIRVVCGAGGNYFLPDLPEILLTEDYQVLKFISDQSQFFIPTSKA